MFQGGGGAKTGSPATGRSGEAVSAASCRSEACTSIFILSCVTQGVKGRLSAETPHGWSGRSAHALPTRARARVPSRSAENGAPSSAELSRGGQRWLEPPRSDSWGRGLLVRATDHPGPACGWGLPLLIQEGSRVCIDGGASQQDMNNPLELAEVAAPFRGAWGGWDDLLRYPCRFISSRQWHPTVLTEPDPSICWPSKVLPVSWAELSPHTMPVC
jgi:hypothetical protein